MINRELIQSKIDNTLLNSEIDKLSQTLDQRLFDFCILS